MTYLGNYGQLKLVSRLARSEKHDTDTASLQLDLLFCLLSSIVDDNLEIYHEFALDLLLIKQLKHTKPEYVRLFDSETLHRIWKEHEQLVLKFANDLQVSTKVIKHLTNSCLEAC